MVVLLLTITARLVPCLVHLIVSTATAILRLAIVLDAKMGIMDQCVNNNVMTEHLGNSAVTYVVIVKRVTHVTKRRGRVLMDVNQGTKESTATKHAKLYTMDPIATKYATVRV
ncbi:uncharacterized protein LOC128171057 [Crassostrea angulata]|uniref:uncharacterized protein LOC128171057 n=1 Tax=Magallana angulata TaxID=2784310 RepID=UPI0022B1D07E|nr:uncharacterized protein LOC128171057 [Crassostrea angulata]